MHPIRDVCQRWDMTTNNATELLAVTEAMVIPSKTGLGQPENGASPGHITFDN
jgi:hypothetical protein